MKYLLLGLILWNAALTGCLYFGYQALLGSSFEISAVQREQARGRVSSARTDRKLNKEVRRERQVELILKKLILVLTDPDSSEPNNNSTGN